MIQIVDITVEIIDITVEIIDITVEIIDIPVAGLNVRQGSRWGQAGTDISKVCHRWVVSAAAAGGEHIRAVNEHSRNFTMRGERPY